MRFIAFGVLGLALAATSFGPLTGDANAQMRTGKGEYYSGITRKPWPSYLYFWITGRNDGAAYGAPARKRAVESKRLPRDNSK
ncbi:hypothetical protein PYH37_005072 [Sinorhizobium numidicum]|uniref:Transmembrane protein n=1 Tax=Sinorhizobium numidicum TaxID=680248 RepID=A0ABY8CXM9_9HYPH|nr:hypothetical protein [Sinorhizobium numidicum]WEX76742.1 hypothetical protein PYH37_005072 [Sinorhizobium numidicum]WEX83403.1 hypothetical protein PYH38_005784 [Sinorhizobium numidicum]